MISSTYLVQRLVYIKKQDPSNSYGSEGSGRSNGGLSPVKSVCSGMISGVEVLTDSSDSSNTLDKKRYSMYKARCLKELKDPIERLSSDPANIVETIAPSPPYLTKELVKAIEPRLKFGPVGKI
ncbi:hypothetical protein ACF0H5_004720 [Mactra antiquata]